MNKLLPNLFGVETVIVKSNSRITDGNSFLPLALYRNLAHIRGALAACKALHTKRRKLVNAPSETSSLYI